MSISSVVDHHQQEEAQVTVLPPLQVLTNTDEQLAQSLTEFAEGSLDAEPKRKLSGGEDTLVFYC